MEPNMRQTLEAPFTPQDVLSALKEMSPCKAPGPDDFHAFFFQHYWHIVGQDVCDLVLQVLRGGHMPEGINDTFITLIPKVTHPERVT